MAGRPGGGAGERGRGAGAFPARKPDRQGAPLGGLSALQRQHGLSQHHPHHPAGKVSRRPGHGAAHPLLRALERHGHGGAGQPPLHGTGRPHLHLCLLGDPGGRGLQPLFQGPLQGSRRRSGVLPGSCGAGHLCARLSGGPHHDHAGKVSRRPRHRAAHSLLRALERHGHGRSGQPPVHGTRRSHRQLCLLGDPLRRRLQPLLPGPLQGSSAAIWSTSRAMPHRASMPAPIWKAASARSSSTTSARRWTATASPPIPTPG